MFDSWLHVVFTAFAFYFGLQFALAIPILLRMLFALRKGSLHWPGPVVTDPRSREDRRRVRLGLPPRRLLPAFVSYATSAAGMFVYSLIGLTGLDLWKQAPPFSTERLLIWSSAIILLIVLLTTRRDIRLAAQVLRRLSGEQRGLEPPQSSPACTEGEDAIEHPLIEDAAAAASSTVQAVDLYVASLAFHQAGSQPKAIAAYQEALQLDPQLHQHARQKLAALLQNAEPPEVAAAYYWLGVHSEQLGEPRPAAGWYEKAARAFGLLGQVTRQGKAYCSLGTVQLKIGDPPQALASYTKAVALNPRDGIAYIHMGMLFYLDSDQSEPGHARALDAFAHAVAAGPEIYGPIVAGKMRSYAYTWKEDLRKVMELAGMLNALE